jgi:hypothetical protein
MDRALQDRSIFEIAKKREEKGCELRAAVYFFEDRLFIVSAIHWIAEFGKPITLTVTDSDEDLGRAICDMLVEYDPTTPKTPPEYGKSAWEALAASGAKTIRHFEGNSIYVSIETINATISLAARPRKTEEKRLFAGGSCNARHEVVGQTLRQVIRATKVLRDSGMF